MQPTTTRHHRVAPRATAPAAPAVGLATPAPAHEVGVLRFTMANGLLEIHDAPTVVRLLEHEQAARLAAEAEQAALSVCYRLGGEPDEALPHGGLLTRRLGVSVRTAQQLIADGKLRYTCAGKKNYRISELAVRQFLGDAPP